MKKVTDPDILAQLNGPVTDPELLAQLNAPPAAAAQALAGASAPAPDVATDIAKQTGVGLGKAAIDVVGFPGAIGQLTEGATDVIGGQATPLVRNLPFVGPLTQLPVPATIQRGVEAITGPFRKAETPEGQIAEDVSGFAAGAIMPGGLARKLIGGVAAPYAGSQAGEAVGGQTGKALGAVLGGFAGGIGAGPRAAQPMTGGKQALHSAAQPGYSTWDQIAPEIIVSQPAFKTAVDDIGQSMIKMRLDEGLHPRAAAVFKRLEAESEPPFKMQGLAAAGSQQPTHISLEGIEILRKNAAQAAVRGSTPADREAARIISDKLEDFMENLTPQQMITSGGRTPQEALAAKKAADKSWMEMRKAEILEGIWEKASTNSKARFSQAGLEHALRDEFKALANSFVPTATRSKTAADRARKPWTPEQIKLINDVARGDDRGNALRWIGRFAPKGVVSTMGTAILGNALAGPAGAVAAAALGAAGHRAATSATLDRVEKVYEAVTGQAPSRRRIPTGQSLARALLAYEGSQ